MTRQLSTAEVARLVGLPEPRIRELVRRGLCRPGRRGRAYAFTFQDVVVLRAARSLQEARVPARRVRRALESLARELPPGRSLSGVRIYADGRQVAVCDGGAAWVPETGQTLFTFEVDGLARQVAALRRAPAGPDPQARARALFEEALDLDGVDDAAAARAYRRALELDPELADAWVNLGRLLQEAGEPAARPSARARRCAAAPTTRSSTSTWPSPSRTRPGRSPRPATTSAPSPSTRTSPTPTSTWPVCTRSWGASGTPCDTTARTASSARTERSRGGRDRLGEGTGRGPASRTGRRARPRAPFSAGPPPGRSRRRSRPPGCGGP